MDTDSKSSGTALEHASHHMIMAETSPDVSERYFHQRQAELYLKIAEIEVRIDANQIAIGHARHVRDLAHQASINPKMKGRVN